MRKIFMDTRNRPRSGFQLLAALFILIFAATLSALGSSLFPNGSAANSVVYAVLYGGVTLVLTYFAFRYLYKNQMTSDIDCYVFEKESFMKLFIGLLLGVICFSIVVLPLYISGQYKIQYVGSPALPLLLNFIFFISVGIVEEITTRGLMQHALLRFGKWPALFSISIVFGLLHLGNSGVTVNAILGVTLAGVLLGLLMYASNSIMLPIGFHITWNWVQGSLYGIPVSGEASGNQIFKTTFVGADSFITGGKFGTEASIVCLIFLVLFSLAVFLYGKKRKRFSIYDGFR